MEVDLSSMASVRGFASAFHERSPKLDVLVNNAAACGHARIVNISTLAAGGLDLSDTQFERRRYSGIAAYRASKQASRMLTWALADELKDEPVTANAVNPGYVLTPLTTNVTGLLKVLVVLTSFKAQSPVEGADTAIWAAGSPELEGVTGKFWNKRHEIRCRFRNTTEIQELRAVVEQQLSDADSFENTPLDRAARPEQAADTVRRASR
jgi:NAD(P)-dependent dehydrogenase (short-subunit alcohol dehydrogenase family)